MSTEQKIRRMRTRNEAARDKQAKAPQPPTAPPVEYREIRDAAGRVIRRLPVQRSW